MSSFQYISCTLLLVLLTSAITNSQKPSSCLNDKYRPQYHYSPAANWINDPNGMVYHNGVYHMFNQYHPFSTIWGPMHWGHATSTDMLHWEEQPIALVPDQLGDIFSGSAVVDTKNTSGLATTKNSAPIIAMYTNALQDKVDKNKYFQQQSLAFSNNNGANFTKYKGNPALPNLNGIKADIRDPKIIPYKDHWILTLAVGDRIYFYESKNLLNWTLNSEFGGEPRVGGHGGVWECPDLLRFSLAGREIWVLFVSINPGGPNNGSATQYFFGDFDGKNFRAYKLEEIQWLGYGPDNYAGVTFSNINRHIYMGWMNNWNYANVVPTGVWRGQMTIPRILSVGYVDGRVKLISKPAPEVERLRNPKQFYTTGKRVLQIAPGAARSQLFTGVQFRNPLLEVDLRLDLSGLSVNDSFNICFTANGVQEVCAAYETRVNRIFLDRGKSGQVGFSNQFNSRSYADRMTTSKILELKIFLDVSSIEIFIDGGFSTLTGIFFPDVPFTLINVNLQSERKESRLSIDRFVVHGLKSIYNC